QNNRHRMPLHFVHLQHTRHSGDEELTPAAVMRRGLRHPRCDCDFAAVLGRLGKSLTLKPRPWIPRLHFDLYFFPDGVLSRLFTPHPLSPAKRCIELREKTIN